MQPLKLYRGFTFDGGPVSVGSLINNQRNKFVSFTSNLEVAQNFASQGCIYILTVAPEDRLRTLLPIEDLSHGEDFTYISESATEHEWILPLGTVFIVSGPVTYYASIPMLPIKIHSQTYITDLQSLLQRPEDKETYRIFEQMS